MRFVDTFDRHRSDFSKTFDAYVKERRLQLGNAIANRYKVYLDTNYWLSLADYSQGKASSDPIAELFRLLHDAVASTRAICPISESVFLEVMKQTDTTTLRRTAELVDTLSCGVSLLSSEERVRMELLHFMIKNLHGEASCHPLGALAWTKLAYSLGLTYPAGTPFAPNEELLLQKVIFDQMWEASLCDILDFIDVAWTRTSDFGNLATELSEGKEAHADENNTLGAMLMSELAGALDAMKPMISEVEAYLFECETGKKPTAEEIASSDASQTLANLIYHGFRLNRITSDLPSIRIPAAIHAAVRWDKRRSYKPQDFHDFNHAGAALPYCDTFLTERSLKHLATRRDLALDTLYGCKVISEPSDAVAHLHAVLASRSM